MLVGAWEGAQGRSSLPCRISTWQHTQELTLHSHEKPQGLWLSQGICCCFSHAPGAPCSVVCSSGSAVAFPAAPVFFLEVSPLHTDQTWCCLSPMIRSAHISRTGRNDIKTYHPPPSQMTCQEADYLCVPGTPWGMCRQTGADWAGKAPEKCFDPVVTPSHCQGRSRARHLAPPGSCPDFSADHIHPG